MTTQLIPVVPATIGHQTVQTVDGRTLHTFLEVQTEFSKWMDRRIDEYGFIEEQDFSSFLAKTPQGGRPSKEYALTLNMGKELAMVERTPKGKQARQYFIECEQRLYAQPWPDPELYGHVAGQMAPAFFDYLTDHMTDPDPQALAELPPLHRAIAELLRRREQGTVRVDTETLARLVRIPTAVHQLTGEVAALAQALEQQIGQPLIQDLTALTAPPALPAPPTHVNGVDYRARVAHFVAQRSVVTINEVIQGLGETPNPSLRTRTAYALFMLGWRKRYHEAGNGYSRNWYAPAPRQPQGRAA